MYYYLDVLMSFVVLLLPIATIMLSIWLINSLYELRRMDREIGAISTALAVCSLVFAILFMVLAYLALFKLNAPEPIVTVVITIAVGIFAAWCISFMLSEIILLKKSEKEDHLALELFSQNKRED